MLKYQKVSLYNVNVKISEKISLKNYEMLKLEIREIINFSLRKKHQKVERKKILFYITENIFNDYIIWQ